MMAQREVALAFIKELRRRRSLLKQTMIMLKNDIIEIDMQIRYLRQRMPKEKTLTKKRKKEFTNE